LFLTRTMRQTQRRSSQAPGVSTLTLSRTSNATCSLRKGPVYTRTKPFPPSLVEQLTPDFLSRSTY